MNKEYDFIKECGAFFVLTINNDFPAGRPFGAIMEHEDDLYISTADMKAVYSQLKDNEHIQIIALKHGTRAWVRVCGIATECYDIAVKQKMMEVCPILSKHYDSADAPHFNLFQVKIMSSEFK